MERRIYYSKGNHKILIDCDLRKIEWCVRVNEYESREKQHHDSSCDFKVYFHRGLNGYCNQFRTRRLPVTNLLQHPSLNACKNILVVVQVMDRPLCATVLRALNFEWGNQRCCVPVPRALIGDYRFRSIRNNPQGGDKKDEKYWNRH